MALLLPAIDTDDDVTVEFEPEPEPLLANGLTAGSIDGGESWAYRMPAREPRGGTDTAAVAGLLDEDCWAWLGEMPGFGDWFGPRAKGFGAFDLQQNHNIRSR